MVQVMAVLNFLWAHSLEIIAALIAVFSGLVTIAVLIPGNQPDAFLAKCLELLNKVSSGAEKIKITFDPKK